MKFSSYRMASVTDEFSAYNFLGWLRHVTYDLPHSILGGYRGARDELIFAPLGRYLAEGGTTIHTGIQLNPIDYDSWSNHIINIPFHLACPFCQSEVGRQVEAGIFNDHFWTNLFLISLPIPILLILAAMVHFCCRPSIRSHNESKAHD